MNDPPEPPGNRILRHFAAQFERWRRAWEEAPPERRLTIHVHGPHAGRQAELREGDTFRLAIKVPRPGNLWLNCLGTDARLVRLHPRENGPAAASVPAHDFQTPEYRAGMAPRHPEDAADLYIALLLPRQSVVPVIACEGLPPLPVHSMESRPGGMMAMEEGPCVHRSTDKLLTKAEVLFGLLRVRILPQG